MDLMNWLGRLEEKIGAKEAKQIHARWLNTLSLMENCGAKLIAASEHSTLVSNEVLRHAAEEFRHAYQFRVMANRIACQPITSYDTTQILGGLLSHHYLFKLNVSICRWLRYEVGLEMASVKEAAYLLVTIAIERRAMHLYEAYEEFVCDAEWGISLKGILREEITHLNEIEQLLKKQSVFNGLEEKACCFERELFEGWCRLIFAG